MEINRCYGCMKEITEYPCPQCGYDPENTRISDYALHPGAILKGKYLLGRVLGQGGFGITYVGWDLALERKVAIKEYFPSGQVSRYPGTTALQWYSTERSGIARQSGMEMFLKEARKMSRVDEISGVVGVRDLFQENDTAYIVMNFIEGETLKSRLTKTGPLGWADAQKIFLPAIEAMEKVHQAGLIHRDLSPDNLMLTPEGTVKILDLGASKDLNVNSGASSMQVAKSGFSPLEQYIQRGSSGTWTDVYALAATMYYTLTGVLPPTAIDRMDKDTLRWDLPQLQALPKNVVSALKQAMALRAKERTQTMTAFAAQLKTGHARKTESDTTSTNHGRKNKPLLLCIAAILLVAIGAGILFNGNHLNAAKSNVTCTYIENETGLTVTGYAGTLPNEMILPRKIDGKPVTQIGAKAFKNCSSLTSVTIPDSVTEIGNFAFSGCTSLTSMTIPDSVAQIGGYAFSGCSSLISVTIPDSVTRIGTSVLSGCSSLTSVTIPDSVTEIGGNAFSGCSSLTSVTIPDSVTSIGLHAFSGCSSLRSATIPRACTLGWEAFPIATCKINRY